MTRLGCRAQVPDSNVLANRLAPVETAGLALSHLAKMGYRADAVADGETALARLNAEPFDAVLLDCQMPELDGYETVRRWRRRERDRTTAEGARRIPVIALTAHAMAEERQKCLAAGMDDYLAKPYRSNDLRQVLDRQLFPEGEVVADDFGPESLAEAALAPDIEERLGALRRLGDETGRDLLGTAIAELTNHGGELVQQMVRALDAGNSSSLADAAHSSIAAAGALGAARLVELLQTIEARALAGHLDGMRELIDAAATESARFQDLLVDMRNEEHAAW